MCILCVCVSMRMYAHMYMYSTTISVYSIYIYINMHTWYTIYIYICISTCVFILICSIFCNTDFHRWTWGLRHNDAPWWEYESIFQQLLVIPMCIHTIQSLDLCRLPLATPRWFHWEVIGGVPAGKTSPEAWIGFSVTFSLSEAREANWAWPISCVGGFKAKFCPPNCWGCELFEHWEHWANVDAAGFGSMDSQLDHFRCSRPKLVYGLSHQFHS